MSLFVGKNILLKILCLIPRSTIKYKFMVCRININDKTCGRKFFLN